jgi:predicted TIM-barrel fold metal-dependent hydrolase
MKQSDVREKTSAMTAWLNMDDSDKFAEKLRELLHNSTCRKIVSIRSIAEAHPDPNFLARENVIKNTNVLGKHEIPFELLIRKGDAHFCMKSFNTQNMS